MNKLEHMYTTFVTEKNQKRRGHFVCHVTKVVDHLVAKLGHHSHVGSLIGAKKGYSGAKLSDLSEAKKNVKTFGRRNLEANNLFVTSKKNQI